MSETSSSQDPREAIAEISRALQEKGKRVLTRPAYEAIVGALDSLEGLLICLGEIKQGDADERVVPFLIGFCSVQKAALAILATYVGLEGRFLAPSKRTLSLLCFAADRYMTEAEDVFLALKTNEARVKGERMVAVAEATAKYGLPR